MLSDSPPERDMEWTEAGAAGAWRFVQRLWRLVVEALPDLPPAGQAPPTALPAADTALRRATHRAIAGVTDDIEKFRFNRAVARLYEFANTLEAESAAGGWARCEAFEGLARLIGPMMPHLAEELWRSLGHDTLVVDSAWPVADPALVIEDQVTLAVQVNGKLRGTVVLRRGASSGEAESAALAEEGVVRAMAGKAARKVIVVPDRVINVVV
jgi:leucyl-tRNA synthetase